MDGTDDRDPMSRPQGEDVGDDDGQDEGEKRSGQPVAEVLGSDDDREHPERDAQRPGIDVAQVAQDVAHLVDGGGPCAADPEDDRELPCDDPHGDPRQHPGDDGCREEVRDPSQPDQPDTDQDRSDRDCGEGHGGRVTGAPDGGNRCHTDGEHRRDGGIRSDRQVAVGADQRVQQRTGDEA